MIRIPVCAVIKNNRKKLIKHVFAAVIFTAALCFVFCAAYAEGNSDTESSVIDEYSKLYSGYLTDGAGEIISGALSPYSDGFSLSELVSRIAAGEIPLSPKGILKELGMTLFGEVIGVLKSMMFVIALAVLSSFLSSMSTSFGKESVSRISYYVCFIAAAGIASRVFFDVQNAAAGTIENLALFMRCIVPVMVTSLVTSGAVISASALEPFLIGIIQIALSLIQSVFFPLVMVGTALGIVNSLSQELKTTGIIALINKTVKYGLSVLLTIFVAFAGLKSIASAGADGLTVKLTKFASSNLIPVIGGILSDSIETVMNCSAVIKNSLGIIGVIIVFFIAAMPLIKITASLLVFRITAAVCEPIGSKGIVECITAMANGISTAFSMLAAVEVMFIMILTIMINISV